MIHLLIFNFSFTNSVNGTTKQNYFYDGHEVIVRGVDPEDFKDFLTYLYTDKITLTNRNVMAILYLANEYKVEDLMNICSEHIKPRINSDNVIEFFQQVCDLKTDLNDTCWKIIEQYKHKVAKSQSFLDMRYSQLIHFIERQPSLFANELEKFKVCIKWAKRQCYLRKLVADGTNIRRMLKTILNKIDFKSLTAQEFTQNVLDYRLFTSEELINFWKYYFSANESNQDLISRNEDEPNLNLSQSQARSSQEASHDSLIATLTPPPSLEQELVSLPPNNFKSTMFNTHMLPSHVISTQISSIFTYPQNMKTSSFLPSLESNPLMALGNLSSYSRPSLFKYSEKLKNSCSLSKLQGHYQVDLFESVATDVNVKENLKLEKDIRKLTFSVDRSVYLRGIGVYGSRVKPHDFNIVTRLIDLNTDSMLTCTNKRLECDGSPSIHFVKFEPYVMIHPNHTYDITIMVSSMRTFYGVGPRNLIIIPLNDNHKVTFSINSTQSTAGREQIACIYFAL